MKSILLIVAIATLILNQANKKKQAAVYFRELPKEFETRKPMAPHGLEAKYDQPAPFIFREKIKRSGDDFLFGASINSAIMLNDGDNKATTSPQFAKRRY
jgi:hypothetical protein